MKISNTLILISEPIFSLLSKVQTADKGRSLGDNYRALIESEMQKFQDRAKQLNIENEKTKSAVYALAAHIDEVVLLSDWPHKSQWMRNTLQWGLFQEHAAGEGFYKRLSELRQVGELQADVLQLYYVCLQLGFQGKYRLQGIEHLHAYLVDFKAQLTAYFKVQNTALSPQKVLATQHKKPRFGQVPFWVITSAWLVLLLGIYTGFKFSTNNAANKANLQLQQIAQMIEQGDIHA